MSKEALKDAVRQGDLLSYSDSSDDSDDEDYCDEVKRPRRQLRPTQELRVRELAAESHATSRLFEIVVMRKHATLSTCLQRLFLTITSHERHIAIADILSFICECAGFRHSSIAPDLVEPYDTAGKTTNVDVDDDVVVSGHGHSTATLSTNDRDSETDTGFANTKTNDTANTVNRPSNRRTHNSDDGQECNYGHLTTGTRSGSRNAELESEPTNISNANEHSTPQESGNKSATSESHITYDSFDWWYFTNMFAALPSEASVSDILKHCKVPSNSQRCDLKNSIFFPDISDLLNNRRSRCLSTKFLQMCLERIKRINCSLEAQDGWTIGFGKRNNAFLRFKEFFQQFVAEAEAIYLGDVLHAFQWIFALSLSGFRAVRQFALIACNEIVGSLIVKLDALSKNERVFCKQLQVEMEMDQRTHERVHGRDSRVSLSVSKSSLELYKKLILAQRGQVAIHRFIKCIYNVNFASKLRDVLIDIRVLAAFALGTNVLLNSKIFSGEHYLDLVYRILPTSDDVTRLLLLRYISMIDQKLTEEQFGILLSLHESCINAGLVSCCTTIEAIMLKDVHTSYERSVVLKHRTEKAFMRVVGSLSKAPNKTLCMLISSVFLPSIPIRDFSLVFQIRADDLRSKYRNVLLHHPSLVGRKSTLVISDALGKDENFHQSFMELHSLLTTINANSEFVTNLITSLWEHTHFFTDVVNTVRFLCQGGDVASVNARLDEQKQKLLLHISIASFEHLAANAKDSTPVQVEAVEAVMSHAPMLLRLYKASHINTKVALHLIEMATSLFPKTKLKLDPAIISALADMVSHLIENRNNSEASICAMRLAIRCLCNLYACCNEVKTSVTALYRLILGELSSKGGDESTTVITLHCALNMLHYFPLELEVKPGMIEVIEDNMKNPEGSDCMLWSAIAYVLYEAHIYKCVKTASKRMDDTFSKLGALLLQSLARQSQNVHDDFHTFVCFCSMLSLVQISSLVGGFEDLPDGVEAELYNIVNHFLQSVRPSHLKNATGSLPSMPIFFDGNKKGISVADIFITGCNESHFTLNPMECVLCLTGLFTKVLSARLYCSGVSVLLLLQIMSSSTAIANAAAAYLRFLANFDDQILSSLFLFVLIGLYESNSCDLLGQMSKRFVGCILGKNGTIVVDKRKLNFDGMIISAVQYAVQCPSNWGFLTTLTDFVKMYKGHGGTIDTAMLHAQIGAVLASVELGENLREKVWHLLNTIGMQADDLLKRTSQQTKEEVNGVNRRLNIIRRIAHYVNFAQVTGVTMRKKSQKLPSSTCIVKRQRNVSDVISRMISGDTSTSITSGEEASTLDVSPIVVRTFTKSQFKALPPSIGLVHAAVGGSGSGAGVGTNITTTTTTTPSTAVNLSLDEGDVTPEFEPLNYYQDTIVEASSPLSKHSSAMQYSSSFGLISPSPSRLSPF